jgi:Domain of unknown function (DUF1906)
MPTLDSFDYSWARPDPAQIAAAGIKAVGRYIWDGGKGTSVGEIKALWASGVGVWLGYEANSGNHLLGAAQGTKDAQDARRLLAELSEIVPYGVPIYFACDQQVSPAQMPTVLAYLNAAAAVYPAASCYAQQSVCDAWGKPSWQTTAWSPGVSAHAAIYQWAIEQDFHGSAVDYNELTNMAQAGVLWPPGHTPQDGGSVITEPTDPTDPTDPSPQEDDMPNLLVAGKLANGQPSGHYWIVNADLSERVVVVDIANFQALAAQPNPRYINAAMSYEQLQAIPDVTDRDGKVSAE